MNKVTIAVIGLGYWGPNLIRNLSLIPSVSQIYGCDLEEKNLLKVKKNFPSVITTNSYFSILEDNNIDAVIIATPVSTHFNLAKKAFETGKHVLVEKPMTTTSSESKSLIKLSKKYKKILMVGHTFIYSEAIKKIKNEIKKNKLGKIYYYDSTRINLGLFQKDINVVWDLAPHDLSIVNHLFSEKPLAVQTFGSSFIGNKTEMAHIFLKLEKNISVHINVSWLSPVKIRSTLLGGSKKMIIYNDLEPSEKIKIYDKGVTPSLSSITPFAPAYRSGDVVIPQIDQKEALLSELSHFTQCILENKEPLTGGNEGLYVVTLLEAIDKALLTRKEIALKL